MAVDIPRTARDAAADALRALAEAEREIATWRAHLARAQGEPTVPVVLQARRSAGIVAALVNDALEFTRGAVCCADVSVDDLPVG